MLGGSKILGGSPLDSAVQKAMQRPQNLMTITDDKIVVCSKCHCEFFIAPIRLAKSKIDLKNEAIGLLQEVPRAFCFNCREELPHVSKLIKTKGDLEAEEDADVKKVEEVIEEKVEEVVTMEDVVPLPDEELSIDVVTSEVDPTIQE